MCQNEGAIEDTPTSPLANRAASSHAQLAQQDSTASASYAGGDPFYDRFPWYVFFFIIKDDFSNLNFLNLFVESLLFPNYLKIFLQVPNGR